MFRFDWRMLLRVRTLRTENVVLVLATSTSARPVTVRVILCCGSDEFEDQYPRTSLPWRSEKTKIIIMYKSGMVRSGVS